MKQRPVFVFCLIFGIAGFAAAQGKSVTNADLEKYKQDRLKAEREYRENYAKLGFPSPEELDRRREQSAKDTELLSAKLRADRLEREQLEGQQQFAAAYYQSLQAEPQSQYYDPPLFFSSGERLRPLRRLPYEQPGYFAGGQFWPTGSRTKPRPLWVPSRH